MKCSIRSGGMPALGSGGSARGAGCLATWMAMSPPAETRSRLIRWSMLAVEGWAAPAALLSLGPALQVCRRP